MQVAGDVQSTGIFRRHLLLSDDEPIEVLISQPPFDSAVEGAIRVQADKPAGSSHLTQIKLQVSNLAVQYSCSFRGKFLSIAYAAAM